MPILNVIIVVGAVGLTTVNGRATMKTYRPWAPEQAYLGAVAKLLLEFDHSVAQFKQPPSRTAQSQM